MVNLRSQISKQSIYHNIFEYGRMPPESISFDTQIVGVRYRDTFLSSFAASVVMGNSSHSLSSFGNLHFIVYFKCIPSGSHGRSTGLVQWANQRSSPKFLGMRGNNKY